MSPNATPPRLRADTLNPVRPRVRYCMRPLYGRSAYLETRPPTVETVLMPELPEVETVARDLRLLLIGRSLIGLTRSRKALRQTWSKTWEAKLLDRKSTRL